MIGEKPMTVRAVAEPGAVTSSHLSESNVPQTTPPPKITGEKLFAMGDTAWTELVKGEIVHMAPTGHLHGFVESRCAKVLGIFVDDHRLGRVLSGEVGIYTGRDPDTVRAADVAFISNERMAQVRSRSYLDVAPELIVEVMSPDDRWYAVHEKLTEYLAMGVQVVWIADPGQCRVHVYRSATQVEILTSADELNGGPVLPGFKVAVAELFGVTQPTGEQVKGDENVK
jgi:Uma2 family endonuclease